MGPPVNAAGSSHEKKRGEKRSDIICRVKYCNTLPQIPFEPKFIKYPFENTRFVQYNPTSLERDFTYELLTEHDMEIGKNLDFLILPKKYEAKPNSTLDPKDEELVEDDTTASTSKRSVHHNKYVSWLRKTEYISTEYNRFAQSSAKSETKVGFKLRDSLLETDFYKDKESQIQAIEHTFEATKKPIERHYSKPNVYPKEVLPVYPDFQFWKHSCAQVIFDSDPALKEFPASEQQQQMSNAVIRGMSDEAGEQFVAYFLPTNESMAKKQRLMEENNGNVPDEEMFEYILAREYNWNVKTTKTKGFDEDLFFVFRPDGVYYNELDTRVRLSKRKRKTVLGKSILITQTRPFSDAELATQAMRMSQLDHVVEGEYEQEANTDTEAAEEQMAEEVEENAETQEQDEESNNEVEEESNDEVDDIDNEEQEETRNDSPDLSD